MTLSAEQDFREMAVKVFGLTDAGDVRRDIIVTPYDGCYGRAGFVIAINGSPPRGLFVVECSGTGRIGRIWRLDRRTTLIAPEALFLASARVRRIYRSVRNLLVERGLITASAPYQAVAEEMAA